jgi:DNA/RNA-binding domain of Phe-tRNA-synthetase-like protein
VIFWAIIAERFCGISTMDIAIQIPGVRLGIVQAEGATISPANAALVCEIEETGASLRQKLTLESLAQADAVLAVRAMFRTWGMDPSKYRPSSEALLRRVVQGKGLYNVSNVVDVTNLGSIETGWPYGVYNRAAISGGVCLRLGVANEKYEGIGRRVWHLHGRPVLADELGPFGSPISDSTRTQIEDGVSAIMTVIYAPATAPGAMLMSAAEKQAARLGTYAGSRTVRLDVIR